MTKTQEYLFKKTAKKMWYSHSDRRGVSEPKEIYIREEKDLPDGISLDLSNGGYIEIKFPRRKFGFNEAPYEMEFHNNDDFGIESQYGSGFGDLWGYTNYCSFDKNKVIDWVFVEAERIKQKYGGL